MAEYQNIFTRVQVSAPAYLGVAAHGRHLQATGQAAS